YQWQRKGAWEAVHARKAFLVETVEELLKEYRHVAPLSTEILIQEYVPGADTDIVVCCCYVDHSHQLLAYFPAKKLRQNPPLFGTGCVMEATNIPEIIPMTQRLLES